MGASKSGKLPSSILPILATLVNSAKTALFATAKITVFSLDD